VRVFLLDDHEVVRRGLSALLADEPDLEVVGEAGTVADALPAILEIRPDVVVIDAQLPDGDGIDVCREMRAVDPGIKGLVLTTYDDEETISAAILAGASGYVLKQIDGSSLVDGIRLVASGHSLVDPAVATRVVERVESHRHSLGALESLTPQQSRILALIAEGMTNRQIAAELHLAEKTVKNHVTGLLARLGVEHRTQAALLALKAAGRSTGETPLSVPSPRSGASDSSAPVGSE